MFLKVAYVAEAILRKSALRFHCVVCPLILSNRRLNVPILTSCGTGTYQTLGHLKISVLTFNVFFC